MPLDSLTYSPSPVALDADGEKLLAAALEIERRGHYKGFFCENEIGPDFGSVCLWGAINIAYGNAPYIGIPIPYSRAIETRLGLAPRSAAEWNDDPSRTAAEVISRLRAAAQGVGR